MDGDWRRGRCQVLWHEQGGTCFFCGRAMPAPVGQRLRHRKRPDSATIDHVWPRSLGGLAAWSNEVAACLACNSTKADRAPTSAEQAKLADQKRR